MDAQINSIPVLTDTLMLAAMNAVSEGIVIVDPSGRILYVNDAYTSILKVSREKVLYQQMDQIEPGAMILDVLQDRKPRRNQCVEVKSRGTKIRVNITPLFCEQRFIGAVSVFKDITDLALSRQELEKAQRLSRSIFKAAAQGPHGITPAFSHIIGSHSKFLRCLRLAELVAPTDATVLIEGESGAGKEVLVDAVRRASGKRSKPFVSVNCSAIPADLMESELFGYESGSFTGAVKGGKAGKFELAHGGTLFLDEIGEMPLVMQAKLLRALQSGEIQKIGANTVQHVDVRVIAATNRSLKQMVREGTFRDDLYFRLHTFTISIPPLRERGQDIVQLAEYFLRRFSEKYAKHLTVSSDVWQQLLSYSWPGNVRELESCMEYAVIVCTDTCIDLCDLPEEIQVALVLDTPQASGETLVGERGLKGDIQAMERAEMIRVLNLTGGNKTAAMKQLGISRRTFYQKWKRYGLDERMYKK